METVYEVENIPYWINFTKILTLFIVNFISDFKHRKSSAEMGKNVFYKVLKLLAQDVFVYSLPFLYAE